MPRTDGVSSNSRTCPILRNPKPTNVALCLGRRPIELLVCFILIILDMFDYPKISLTDKPRFAAIFSGEFISTRALTVARTTFIGFVEP
jgi:hypothetical protein